MTPASPPQPSVVPNAVPPPQNSNQPTDSAPSENSQTKDPCTICENRGDKERKRKDNERTQSTLTEDNYITCNDLEQRLEACQVALEAAKWENFILKIDKFKLEKAEKKPKYKTAEKIYTELISKQKEVEKNVDSEKTILNLKFEFAEMQIARGNYPEAEEVARDVLDKRASGEADFEGIKSSRRQLSSALWKGKKFEEAERMFRDVFPPKDQQDLWTLENGDMLCLVLKDRNQYENACALQRNVWEARAKTQSPTHKDTLQSALRLVEILKYQVLTEEKVHKASLQHKLMKVLEEVWGLWKPGLAPEGATAILDFGRMFGEFHHDEGNYSKAREVLEPVWEGMKSRLAIESAISVGVRLASSYLHLKMYTLAEQTSIWVWERSKVKFGAKDRRTIDARCELGQVMFEQQLYAGAGNIFDEVYRARKSSHVPGPHAKETLDCGYKLSQCLVKQTGKLLDAMRMIKEVFESWKKVPDGKDGKDIALLKNGYLYGTLLFELATSKIIYVKKPTDPPNLLQAAEDVLDMVWKARGQKPGLSRAEILESGRCLGFSKIWLDKDSIAREVLKSVWARKKEVGEETQKVLEYGQRLGSSLVDRGKYTIAKEILSELWVMEEKERGIGVYESPGCGYTLGVCFKELEQWREAVNILDIVWERLQGSRAKERTDCAFILGYCLMKMGEFIKANDVLRECDFDGNEDRVRISNRVSRKARDQEIEMASKRGGRKKGSSRG
jgi:tetratricopeptide (TPR) repeat protein